MAKKFTEVEKGTLKDYRHPMVCDFFPDAEIQSDVGRNQLYDVIRGKHVALIEYSPGEWALSVVKTVLKPLP